MYESEFPIRSPKISLTKRIIFSLVFSLFFTLLFYLAKTVGLNRLVLGDLISIGVFLIWVLGVLITFLLPLIARHIIHINFSKLKIRHCYEIGNFTYKEKWQNLKNLKYLTIYQAENGFGVNLWYNENKILNLFGMEDIKKVISQAVILSDKLKIDLLDSRIRGDHKWVNKSIYKDTGNIEYFE